MEFGKREALVSPAFILYNTPGCSISKYDPALLY